MGNVVACVAIQQVGFTALYFSAELVEGASMYEAVLTIPGLRGQPSGSLAVDVTPTTCTVSSFGFAVWSCVLRGRADAESAVVGIRDGDDLTPVITVCVDKAPGSQRWGGFIADIGEDSLL